MKKCLTYALGDGQWKIYRMKNEDWLPVFMVPVPVFPTGCRKNAVIE